jgi:hypothetical protein
MIFRDLMESKTLFYTDNLDKKVMRQCDFLALSTHGLDCLGLIENDDGAPKILVLKKVFL